MGRILKLLTSALEQSKGWIPFFHFKSRSLTFIIKLDSGMLSLGDSGELSPNASVMLRISTLSAWAELQVASSHHSYLRDVVSPFKSTLSGLWVSALRDYATIKGDSEVFQDSGGQAMDSPYAGLGREVLLPVSTHIFLHRVL